MFKQGWAPRKCKWKEVEDKEGGAYYVNGKTALWEVPVELLLFEMKKVREEEELKLRKVHRDMENGHTSLVHACSAEPENHPPKSLHS